MADIQITGAEVSGPYIFIYRTIDGEKNIERMPKETLAIRAAEYGLEVDDPFVLEMVLHENFIVAPDPDEIHPLFSAPTPAAALKELRARVKATRDEHGAPKGKLRTLVAAIDAGTATQGAADARDVLLAHADPRVIKPVQVLVQAERERLATSSMSLVESLERQAADVTGAPPELPPAPAKQPAHRLDRVTLR